MDPTSVLGAAAASAQLLGFGIKGLVYAAQLLRDMKGAPDDSLRIVTRLGKEVTSINRLLSSDHLTVPQYTTAQREHIEPWALEARKTLDEANRILSPLSTRLGELKSQGGAIERVELIWKSILTVRAMRKVEKQMETIQMLNISLIRGLLVAGFEIEYLLREQSAEVLAKVTEITITNKELRQSTIELRNQHDKASEMLIASSTSIVSGLGLLNQSNEQHKVSLAQAMSSMDDGMSAVRRGLQVIDESSRTLNLSVERVGTTIKDQNHLLATQLRNFIRVQSAENQMAMVSKIKDMFVTELLATVHHFAGFNQDFIKMTDFISPPNAIPKSTGFGHRSRNSILIKCSCVRGKVSTAKRFGLIRFKVDHQYSQDCPLHGRIGQHTYSIETKLSPWLNGALELTLRVLYSNTSWSILPSLTFRGTVKRSESPIYQLFDNLLAAIPKDHWQGEERFWARPNTRKRLSTLIFGIKHAVTLGSASCSDVDEYGNNLLTETTYLMGSIKDRIPLFADEIHELLEMARRAQVDPTARMDFHTGSGDVFLDVCGYIHQIGLHRYFLHTSIYNTISEYDAMAESLQTQFKTYIARIDTIYIDWLIKDPEFAAGAGYSDPIYQAVLRRSLDGLKRYFRHDRKYEGLFDGDYASLLVLAVGWPEGLQYLIEHQECLDLYALEYALEKEAVDSVKTILSADSAKLFSLEALAQTSPDHLYPSLLLHCQGDLGMFRRATEKLWNRYEDFKHVTIDSFRASLDSSKSEKYRRYQQCVDLNFDLFRRLRERSGDPSSIEERDPFTSTLLYYRPFRTGLPIHKYHQILHDAGYVHTDTAVGGIGTPLAYHCRLFMEHLWRIGNEQLYDTAWWFLSKGADPNFWFWRGSEDRSRWSHLKFYVAATMGHDYSVSHKLLSGCGQEYVQDECICPCSSGGCIPPFKLWATCKGMDGNDDHGRCHSHLSRRWAHLTHWMNSLKYSTSRREHTYREVCRLELFDRLGMKHSCCMRSYHDVRERKHFRREDARSEKQLELLMRFYKEIRRLFSDQPVERFWSIWWSAADVIVLPFHPTEACTWPSWNVPETKRARMSIHEWEKWEQTLTVARDNRWVIMLESSGHKGWEYDDAIKHHFVKLWLRAKEHNQRKRLRKRHRLMLKPKFIDQRRRNISKNTMNKMWE